MWFVRRLKSPLDRPGEGNTPVASAGVGTLATSWPGLGILVLALALCLGTSPACGDDTAGAASASFPLTAPPIPANTYPQYRLDPSHTGLSPPRTLLGSSLVMAWKSGPFGLGNYPASKSSPAVDVDRVYVGVDDGELIALDRRSGAIAWHFRTHRYQVELATTDPIHLGIHGSPALDENNVYIGDYSGYLYALDKVSGELRWESLLGGSIGASPVVLGRFVFMAVEYPEPDGKIFVIDAETGAVAWSTPFLGQHPHSSVSIDAPHGLMFVGANNGTFYCFDYVGRRLAWAFQTGAEIKSTAAVAEGSVYLTSWDARLRALRVDNGQQRLEYRTSGASMSSPSVYQSTVYFGSDDGILYAVDADDGHLKWAFQTEGPILSSPTVIQESSLVAIGSKDGHVYLLDLMTGELRQSLLLASAMTSVPVALGDSLFVNDDSGTLYSFRNPNAPIDAASN